MVHQSLAVGLLVLGAIYCMPRTASAAEPELVGDVAILLEEGVAKQLNLTPQQFSALEKLVDNREDAGLDLALRIKDLPPAERAVQLAPFREESESLGMNLLNKRQRSELRAIIQQRNNTDALPIDDTASMPDPDPPVTMEEELPSEPLTTIVEESPSEPPATMEEESPSEPLADESSDTGAPPEPSKTADVVKPQLSEEVQTAHTPSGKLRFNFRFQPWREVLDWFAQQADLSLVMDAPPPGTFNYSDFRDYTPTEAIDLLNGVLLTKGYTLVRRGRMLMVINLEDGIPPNLVSFIPLSELDERGEHELVRVVFPLAKLSAEEARAEIESLLGPQGSIIILPKSRQIQVTETAGRLRAIRSIFDAVENPLSARGELREITLQHRVADEVLPVVRQMLGMAEESNILSDGSLRIAVDLNGRRLIVQGDVDQLRQLDNILKLLDVSGQEGSIGIVETPQLEVYSVSGADPNSALAVLQTILAGDPDARLGLDPQTGNIVALARPSQQAMIRATITQMQRDARQIDVISLSSVDPQTAVLAINRLFGTEVAEGQKPDPTAPKVEADLTTRSLLVRASPSQLEQIRALLEKLGENLDEGVANQSGGNVRLLLQTGRSARSALDQIEQIWPTMRTNRIRIVTPSASGIPTFRPGDRGSNGDSVIESFGSDGSSEGNRNELDSRIRDMLPFMDGLKIVPEASPTAPAPESNRPDEDASTDTRSRVRATFASQLIEKGSIEEGPQPDFSNDRESAAMRAGILATPPINTPGAPILVAPGPGGVLVASQDLDALDAFEDLFNSVANRASTGGRELAVYYLRFAKANVISETLTEIFGGSSGSAGGGGGGVLGSIAGAALGGGAGGDLVGNLLGLGGGGGGGGIALGALDIVPDTRLNALVVRGTSEDLDTLEQLLQILDQSDSPEDVQVDAPPRMIPIYNTTADYIADVIQKVFQDRMRTSAGQQQRQTSPEDMIRALRGGGRGGRGGNTNREQEEAAKMSIGVDTRSNSLVVRAPDPLFEEVKKLATQLDTIDSNVRQATQIISLKATNPATVQEALTALYGQSVQMTGSTAGGGSSSRASTTGRGGSGGDQGATDMQRRMEFFQRMRQMQSSGGANSGRSGRPTGGSGRGGRGR